MHPPRKTSKRAPRKCKKGGVTETNKHATAKNKPQKKRSLFTAVFGKRTKSNRILAITELSPPNEYEYSTPIPLSNGIVKMFRRKKERVGSAYTEMYIGQINDRKQMDGKGVLELENGNKMNGTWKNGKIVGKYKMEIHPDNISDVFIGDKSEGEIRPIDKNVKLKNRTV